MRHKQLKLILVLLFGIGLSGLRAQLSVNASGGNASGSGGNVSYSIGQVVYTTNTGTNGSVAQGVQQPFVISVVSGLEEAKGINLILTAYPNPATNFIILKLDALTTISIQSMGYQLFDINGKLLETKKLVGSETSIAISNLVHSTYFLKVTQENKEVKTFKIIKN
ncbi:MAG: T9SS type A sorting domain-containing protein [Bacteroidales bacterium]